MKKTRISGQCPGNATAKLEPAAVKAAYVTSLSKKGPLAVRQTEIFEVVA